MSIGVEVSIDLIERSLQREGDEYIEYTCLLRGAGASYLTLYIDKPAIRPSSVLLLMTPDSTDIVEVDMNRLRYDQDQINIGSLSGDEILVIYREPKEFERQSNILISRVNYRGDS